MIVTKAFITYRCSSCGLDYIIKFAPLPPENITKVNESIDKTKQCTVCGRAAGIEQIVFRTTEDLYGNDLYGSWQCPIHSAFVYYPTLMRKAEKEKALKDINPVSEAAGKYRKIIIDGYPWVCPNPGCKQSMIYRDDRENRLYG